MAHFGRPKGKVVPEMSLCHIAQLWPMSWVVPSHSSIRDYRDAVTDMPEDEVLLLENLRFNPGEEANDPELASALATLGDVYVNDAFSAAHRAHASTEAIAKLLPILRGSFDGRGTQRAGKRLARPSAPLSLLLAARRCLQSWTCWVTWLARSIIL